jgi:hypothetical protein
MALVGVLLLAKVLGLAPRDLPSSVLLPSVLVWDDVAVGVLFWGAARWLLPATVASTAYWLIALWVALNVAVVRTLSSPLTPNMLRAAGGALSDSIVLYLTPGNVTAVAAVVLCAALLPRTRMSTPIRRGVAAAALAVAIPGPMVEAYVDASGLQRNAVAVLVRAALPRVPRPTPDLDEHWRRARSGAMNVTPDLEALRGVAHGRNVVIVVLESAGAGYLRTYGASDDPMPTVTTLAQSAVQFEAYAAYPESIKGLFALLCSRHPAVDVSVFVHAAAPCDPLAGALGERRYQRGLFHSGRFDYLGMDAVVARQQFDTFEDAGVIGGSRESSFGIDERSTIERMLGWIDGLDPAHPFLMVYLPIAGHHPYAAPGPPAFSGPGPLVDYKNALRYADTSLAALFDGLRARGLWESTVVAVLGDHGQAFGQHDGNIGHTLFIYEENVRVPLLISIPGVTKAPLRSTRIASVIDVAPTLLELLGVPVPASHEGLSLLDTRQATAYFSTDYALGWAGLRDGCWKYLLELESRRSYLFDLCRDPHERYNLVSSHGARDGAYRTRVLGWAAATRRSYDARSAAAAASS